MGGLFVSVTSETLFYILFFMFQPISYILYFCVCLLCPHAVSNEIEFLFSYCLLTGVKSDMSAFELLFFFQVENGSSNSGMWK